MIPTYCHASRAEVLNNYYAIDLVGILINDPTLGLTDTPNPTELNNRKSLIMSTVIANELSINGGYKRAICELDPLLEENELNRTRLFIRALFNPTDTFDPATHIVYVRGANLIGITDANGNNRGDVQGTVLKVAPLEFAPVNLVSPVPYTYTTDITINY